MGKKERKLNLHGGLATHATLTPVLQKIKKFLDDLPVDEAYAAEDLAVAVGHSIEYVSSHVKRLGEKYRYKAGRSYGYGNPETVRLQKEGFYERQESED